ncbi:uncharacterized protein LOC110027625 isoform X2 [Phalaenopsis equestris]|uniref:uncharacterized protein LOC110027625 isoform X2 n=1 Tax=Phalaenopsis equestris TaxID=78828 RepID=UPI0009E24E2A|nr:uncharacterized protein LOC110027625 isoform X2 [Phalaenopsis equestris]
MRRRNNKTETLYPPSEMEEQEFRRILDLFPVVRSRDYCFQDGSGKASSSHSTEEATELVEGSTELDKMDELIESEGERKDAFWSKLQAAAERKVGSVKAKKFCLGLKLIHQELVNKELGLESAKRYLVTDKQT